MADPTTTESPLRLAPPDELAKVERNVRIVKDMLKEPPSREGVALLDDFIDRNWRTDDGRKKPMLGQMSGCYLGAALIAEAGGEWIVEDAALAVRLAPGLIVFPLSKAQKHWAAGPQESVLWFFDLALKTLRERRGERSA